MQDNGMSFFKSYKPILFTVFFLLAVAVFWMRRSAFNRPVPMYFHSGPPPSGKFQWHSPDTSGIPLTAEGALIRYGRDLIANTSRYLGPRGKLGPVSNGMNCQNCHLEAGTKPWGNNYSAVFSTYPKFRARSGTIENIYRRVNDCLQRSLNGNMIDTGSREMRAIYAYMEWLGRGVPKNIKPEAAGIADLPYLERAADTARGRLIYHSTCQSCHGSSGGGLIRSDSCGYTYPPLWGPHSYTTGAGLYRISRFAGFVKNNMPFGSSYKTASLTNEEAWDVAAYVNAQVRPEKRFSGDWPDIAVKPPDYPFGPYADHFSENQHKYGPFKPLEKEQLQRRNEQTLKNR
jgi:thiosulfate dehydrogenase